VQWCGSAVGYCTGSPPGARVYYCTTALLKEPLLEWSFFTQFNEIRQLFQEFLRHLIPVEDPP